MAKTGLTWNAIRLRGMTLGLPGKPRYPAVDPKEQVKKDIETGQNKTRLSIVQASYKEALGQNEELRKRLDTLLELKETPINTYRIHTPKGHGGEATMIALASDWHIEEEVKPDAVNGLNFYNLEESKRRAMRYFQVLLKLTQIEQRETKIDNLIIGLLGDFISGDIHEDVSKSCLIQPTKAIIRCMEYIVSGVDYLLENSELNITLVCHSGNHGRKDKEQMIANESGNSLEFMMYHMLKIHYRNNPRVTFIIPEAYHSYVDVYGKVIRFHHGHAMRFGGGVGGFTIPVNKAIAQWNRAKKADIDCFGHFHQIFDGGNFVANGSMIGFNAYAINIKAAYEKPAQMLFGVHSKLGKYVVRPIFFE